MVPAVLVASVVDAIAGRPSPLEGVAEAVMQGTPVPIAEALLLHLLSISRFAALLGAFAIALAAGGVAGVLYALPGSRWWQRVLGLALAAVFVTVIFFGLFAPGTLAEELLLIACFLGLLPLTPRAPSPAPGRRQFLRQTAVIVTGAVALLTVHALQTGLTAVALRRIFPYRAPRGLPASGLADLVTSQERLYVMDKVVDYPLLDPAEWGLTVDGAVKRPLTLDWAALTARPAVSRYVTIECVDNPVGGPLIGNALWTGVPVADLLTSVGAYGNTVLFHAADDYAEPVLVPLLERSGAMIVYAVNGETLSREHGYPARLLLPGVYGFKSVKWLTRLEVVVGPAEGHWAAYGWTPTASIYTTTRIDVARRSGQEVTLAGIAFAGSRGVAAVEVRVNRGLWRRARLSPALSSDAWRQWTLQLHGPPGATVEVRAVDGTGVVQPERRHGAYPDGASGWAMVRV